MIHHARWFDAPRRLATLVGLTLALASTATAQVGPGAGGKVFGLVGGSFGDGEAAVSTSGGAGVRLTRHLGLDLEVTHLSSLDLSEDDVFIFPLTFAPPIGISREAHLTAFLTKLNVDFPVGDRLIPFISGGGGVGRLSEEISFDRDWLNTATGIPPQLGQRIGDRRPLIFPPNDITRSETGLVLTIGGGLDVLLWKGFGVGVDARWLRLLSDRSAFDVAQVTSRVSVRF